MGWFGKASSHPLPLPGCTCLARDSLHVLPAEAEQYFHCLNEFYCTFLCDSCTWGETQAKRAEERSRKLPEEAKSIPVGPFAASCHRVLVTRGCTQVFCVGGLKMPMGTADGCPAPTAWAESAEIWLWGC